MYSMNTYARRDDNKVRLVAEQQHQVRQHPVQLGQVGYSLSKCKQDIASPDPGSRASRMPDARHDKIQEDEGAVIFGTIRIARHVLLVVRNVESNWEMPKAELARQGYNLGVALARLIAEEI
ncbi:hypothetical protein HYQ46_004249 [Verticillium longisporum]|nr:hypothetical protein HYQ46_004249 [Verticillium longisporum]